MLKKKLSYALKNFCVKLYFHWIYCIIRSFQILKKKTEQLWNKLPQVEFDRVANPLLSMKLPLLCSVKLFRVNFLWAPAVNQIAFLCIGAKLSLQSVCCVTFSSTLFLASECLSAAEFYKNTGEWLPWALFKLLSPHNQQCNILDNPSLWGIRKV